MELPLSIEQYVWERGNFLRQHPDHADKGDSVWHDVRPLASQIFRDQPPQALSVATILARETSIGVSPTTPLQPRMIPQPQAVYTGTSEAIAMANTRQALIDSAALLPSNECIAAELVTPRYQPEAQMYSTDPPASSSIRHDSCGETISLSSVTRPDIPRTTISGVSALAKRPMNTPVKVSHHRKCKRRSANYDVDGSSEDELSARKPKKAATKTAKKSRVSRENHREQPASKQQRQPRMAAGCPSETQPEAVQVPLQLLADPEFRRVVQGHALPHTRDEAIYAQAERKRHCLREYMAAKADKKKHVSSNSRMGLAKEPERIPDLMPEFFERDNFMKGEDPIRCVCGSQDDKDNDIWIGCDTCKVWQHHDCMGAAVPANLKKDPYYCHVCDPWGHRELISKLRRDEYL